MIRTILAETTLDRISSLGFWGTSLVTGLLTVRAMNDFMQAFDDPDVGIKEALRKSKNRVYAAIIAITVDSLVAYFKFFYGG